MENRYSPTTQMDSRVYFDVNNSVLINEILKDVYSKGDVVTILLITLYIPVFIIGILGNAFMVLIVTTTTRLRTVTNIYLSNMAIADFAVCVVCIPMAVGQAVYTTWIYGEVMCKLSAFLQGVTVCGSILTITVLSLDRLLAIRHPMLFKRIANYKMAAKTIIIVWILSGSVMVPLVFYSKRQTLQLSHNQTLHFCHEEWPSAQHRQIYDSLLFVFVYIIPGGIIATSYGLLGRKLWTEDEALKREESEISRGMSRKIMAGRKRIAKMLVALAIFFAVCWLPYYIVTLYLDFESNQRDEFLIVLPFTIYLGHANSALNPILYFYTSHSFRRNLLKLIRCEKNHRRHDTPMNLLLNQQPRHDMRTEKLSRIPLIRRLKGTSHFSRSNSFKFSRSTNTSLKSLNNSNSSSIKRRENAKKDVMGNRHRDSPGKRRDNLGSRRDIPVIKLTADVDSAHSLVNYLTTGQNHGQTKHRKAIMEDMLSIPTTIQEESSRSRASSVCHRPSMAGLPEELWRSSSEKLETTATIEASSGDAERLAVFV